MSKSSLKQDLTQKENHAGGVFVMHLLMEEKCDIPNKETMQTTLNAHLGEVGCVGYSQNSAHFAAKKYASYFEKDKLQVHPQLIITPCSEIQKPIMDEIALTQLLWSCAEANEILETCKYQVITTDMLASNLDSQDRAQMLMDYLEALMVLYPTCKAVVFEASKKMLTREYILNSDVPKEDRFVHYVVNIRFFNIEGTNDMMVDTLGMGALFLPDLQYHFHSIDPQSVVMHAYSTLFYIYQHNNPFEDGHTIAGLSNGDINPDVFWKLQYENALIQPIREVIDVNMGEFAAGKR